MMSLADPLSPSPLRRRPSLQSSPGRVIGPVAGSYLKPVSEYETVLTCMKWGLKGGPPTRTGFVLAAGMQPPPGVFGAALPAGQTALVTAARSTLFIA